MSTVRAHVLSRRLLAVVLIAAAVLAGIQLMDAPPADAASRGCAATAANQVRAERQFRRRINAARDARDLRVARVDGRAIRVARRWSSRMASSDTLAHNPSYGRQLGAQRWRRAAENVGYRRATGHSCKALANGLHRALMQSSGHRKNILGPYNRVGVGVRIERDGTMWVTQNFLRLR